LGSLLSAGPPIIGLGKGRPDTEKANPEIQHLRSGSPEWGDAATVEARKLRERHGGEWVPQPIDRLHLDEGNVARWEPA
jgi:hypothetical protein